MDQEILYIIKIGGSVATHKNRKGASVRRKLLLKIAQEIKKTKKQGEFNLILIHGAGAGGHQIARKYKLASGTLGNKNKIRGSLLSSVANQKLNNSIFDIFYSGGLNVYPIHTASTIIQKNKIIDFVELALIKKALANNFIPILYGEMVFDEELGMSICSGDAIAPYLAKKLKARKVFFASDIDGIFSEDPHKNKKAKLIEKINLKEINKKVSLGKSHNTDVTGGLMGKVRQITNEYDDHLESIEIFNGLNPINYRKVILGEDFSHTIIEI